MRWVFEMLAVVPVLSSRTLKYASAPFSPFDFFFFPFLDWSLGSGVEADVSLSSSRQQKYGWWVCFAPLIILAHSTLQL